MYNYQNTRKHNESYQRKASGPNADQAKLAMQPGAYRMPGANKVPDWVTAAGGMQQAPRIGGTKVSLAGKQGAPAPQRSPMPLTTGGGIAGAEYLNATTDEARRAIEMAKKGKLPSELYGGKSQVKPKISIDDIMEETRDPEAHPSVGMDQDRISQLNRMYGAPPEAAPPPEASPPPRINPSHHYSQLEKDVSSDASQRVSDLENSQYRAQKQDQEQLEGAVADVDNATRRRYSGALTPQQQREANARADRAIGNAEAIMLDSQNTRDGYAARTESLRKEADNVARRTDRAESALRGELGPRAPQADISGPYYRDEQTGLPKNNRVTSNYSISEAQKAREDKLREEMQRDGDAYRARLAEQDAATARELGLQARDKDGVFIKDEDGNPMPDVAAVQQMHRDAADFSAARAIYKRGGGTLPIRDYIKQAAKQGKLSPALTKQLEVNYGLDLSPGKLEALSKEDIDAPRDTAIANRKAEREAAAEARRPIAEEAREINAQVAADRAAGYYNTRPFRVQERNKREAENRLYENEMGRLDKELEVASSKERRELDRYYRDRDEEWANTTAAEIEKNFRGSAGDPRTPAGQEWLARQREYQERTGRPVPGAATTPAADEPPAAGDTPPAAAPEATEGQPDATPPESPSLGQEKVAKFHRELQAGAIDISPELTGSELTNELARKAKESGLSTPEVIEALKTAPSGAIDLSDPKVAREKLREVVEEANAYAEQIIDESDDIKDHEVQGAYRAAKQRRLDERYGVIVEAAKSVMEPEDFDATMNHMTWRQRNLYDASGPESPMGLNWNNYRHFGRGLFGGS